MEKLSHTSVTSQEWLLITQTQAQAMLGFWTKDLNHSTAIESCWSTFSCLTPAAVKRPGLAVHFGTR